MKKFKNFLKTAYLTVSMVACTTVVPAFAAGASGGGSGSGSGGTGGTDVTGPMGKVLGLLLTIMTYLGAGLALWGVYELVMSLTQDMPEKKVKGIALLAGGVLLIGVKGVLTAVGVSESFWGA